MNAIYLALGAQQHAGKDYTTPVSTTVLFEVLPCICCSQVLVPTAFLCL